MYFSDFYHKKLAINFYFSFFGSSIYHCIKLVKYSCLTWRKFLVIQSMFKYIKNIIIFLLFLSDELLLEVGLLCILIAPFPFQIRVPQKKRNLRLQSTLASLPHDSIAFWLVRWLLFRVAFSAGVSKMNSGATCWYDLTGMLHLIIMKLNLTNKIITIYWLVIRALVS